MIQHLKADKWKINGYLIELNKLNWEQIHALFLEIAPYGDHILAKQEKLQERLDKEIEKLNLIQTLYNLLQKEYNMLCLRNDVTVTLYNLYDQSPIEVPLSAREALLATKEYLDKPKDPFKYVLGGLSEQMWDEEEEQVPDEVAIE